jgi:hypothetical protein
MRARSNWLIKAIRYNLITKSGRRPRGGYIDGYRADYHVIHGHVIHRRIGHRHIVHVHGIQMHVMHIHAFMTRGRTVGMADGLSETTLMARSARTERRRKHVPEAAHDEQEGKIE